MRVIFLSIPRRGYIYMPNTAGQIAHAFLEKALDVKRDKTFIGSIIAIKIFPEATTGVKRRGNQSSQEAEPEREIYASILAIIVDNHCSPDNIRSIVLEVSGGHVVEIDPRNSSGDPRSNNPLLDGEEPEFLEKGKAMEQWMFSNRRKYPRLKAQIPVLYWGKNGSSSIFYTENISANGISLISNRPIRDFTRFEIDIELPTKKDSTRLISCRAMAVRTEIIHASKGIYKVGLFITQIAPSDRRALATFVSKKLRTRVW